MIVDSQSLKIPSKLAVLFPSIDKALGEINNPSGGCFGIVQSLDEREPVEIVLESGMFGILAGP